jgi:hypothetical protein
MALAMMGLLAGCGDNENGDAGIDGDTSDIVTIETSRMSAGGGLIEITNYQVIFRQDPDEWNALSDAKREDLVKEGYDRALTQIATDSVSNYTIAGMTSPAKVAEGDPDQNTAQLAFMLNLEQGTLMVCTGMDGTQPLYSAHIPIGSSES